jgi:hypothetical protein
MSLEEALKELTEAVRENTAYMKHIHEGGHRLKPEEEIKAEAPNVEMKSPPTTDTSQSSFVESVPVNYDDVKRATNAVSAKHGVEKTKSALSRFGVASAKALTEAQWPEYVDYMAKVAAGELDPEASHE